MTKRCKILCQLSDMDSFGCVLFGFRVEGEEKEAHSSAMTDGWLSKLRRCYLSQLQHFSDSVSCLCRSKISRPEQHSRTRRRSLLQRDLRLEVDDPRSRRGRAPEAPF